MATARLDDPQPALADELLSDASSTHEQPGSSRSGSLFDDVGALVEDGKTYAEAELAYQKSRLLFASGHAKWVAIFGGLALVLVVLALVALVIGALLALVPVLGAWGATAVVVAVLVVASAILLGLAKARWSHLAEAFAGKQE
ncbi:MAG TPA: phage holin family protein [Sphingomonadaceae bacterium]